MVGAAFLKAAVKAQRAARPSARAMTHHFSITNVVDGAATPVPPGEEDVELADTNIDDDDGHVNPSHFSYKIQSSRFLKLVFR